ncbi:lipase family protein [Rhodococcoides kroppenstedtii]|nr:lipase family protein [Rhodococcus kroppenstedtii]
MVAQEVSSRTYWPVDISDVGHYCPTIMLHTSQTGRSRTAAVAVAAALALMLGWSSVAATPSAVAAPALPDISEPTPPADSFYDRPADLDEAAPGEVLRSRPVAVRALQLLPIAVDAWQLLYRTTAADGSPDATVTTVMIPRGASPKKLLSYQAATDATLRECNPSYSLTQGLPIDFSVPAGPLTLTLPGVEVLLATSGLAQGWAVTMPDHGGVDARFLTPRQPGFAVLDGIRAAQSFSPAGLEPNGPTALWGYSGGAIASSWAVEEKEEYAPELNIVGAAFGAPERDLEASLQSANGGLLAGLIPVALNRPGPDGDFVQATSRSEAAVELF